jgi:hypothetical protein
MTGKVEEPEGDEEEGTGNNTGDNTGDNNTGDATCVECIESANNSRHATDIFDLQGRRTKHPTKGVYIVDGNKVLIK